MNDEQPGLSPETRGLEDRLYRQRFGASEDRGRAVLWEVLSRNFLTRWIRPEHAVLDVGAGDGLFLRSVDARERIAVDPSPHALALETAGIRVIQASAVEFADRLDAPVDVVMMSNLLEHLPEKDDVFRVLEQCQRALAPGGLLMILQPNIRYVGPAYWDYIDHRIALTEHSVVEALEVMGFEVLRLIPRFLPYTAKSWLGRLVDGPLGNAIIALYLKLPLLWRIFGRQTFVVARRP